VREVLVAKQRTLAGRGGIVMVGRDIGTVVLPDAEAKVYLIASVESRARRRHSETLGRRPDGFQTVLDNLKERDRIDSTRAASPLRPAADAMILDTEHLDLDQVVDAVEAHARQVSGSPGRTG
jgi:cytidylate kinase